MSEKSRLIIVAVIAMIIGLIFGHFNVPSRWIVDEPQTNSGVTGPAAVESRLA